MNLYLVRHGTSLRAKVGIWGRLYDADLDPDRLSQLEDTRAALAQVPDPVVFSSPLSRCVHTALLVLDPSTNITIVDEFRAYHSGDLEDKTEAFIRATYPDYLSKSYRARFLSPQFHEESIAAQTARVTRGLTQVLQSTSDNIVVVAHFSVINVIANIASYNQDVASYADGRFEISEGGYLMIPTSVDVLLETLSK